MHTVIGVQVDQRLYGFAQNVCDLQFRETSVTTAKALHQIGD